MPTLEQLEVAYGEAENALAALDIIRPVLAEACQQKEFALAEAKALADDLQLFVFGDLQPYRYVALPPYMLPSPVTIVQWYYNAISQMVLVFSDGQQLENALWAYSPLRALEMYHQNLLEHFQAERVQR